jgi:hypothetical protein
MPASQVEFVRLIKALQNKGAKLSQSGTRRPGRPRRQGVPRLSGRRGGDRSGRAGEATLLGCRSLRNTHT